MYHCGAGWMLASDAKVQSEIGVASGPGTDGRMLGGER